jgi:hypothetical protein
LARISRSCRSCCARVNEARTMMDRDMVGRQLDELPSGDSMDIDKDTLGMLFPPGETAAVIDPRTRSAATKFARDHNCRFLFDDASSPPRLPVTCKFDRVNVLLGPISQTMPHAAVSLAVRPTARAVLATKATCAPWATSSRTRLVRGRTCHQ